jgi:nucleoside-diphosphate-sugar epimerase
VGTASICGAALIHCLIHEDQSPDPSATHLVKYCHTKMVGEIEARRLLPKEHLLIVRPSIIMGDTHDWTPRSYIILWALAALNAMRLIPTDPKARLDIIPIDYAANAVLQLLFARRNWNTYHISAGKDSATSVEKLVHAIHDPCEKEPAFKFVGRDLLQQMKRWPKKLSPSSELHRYREHLAYWQSVFNGNGNLRLLLSGREPYFQFIELNQTFDNCRLRADTLLGNPTPPHVYMRANRKYLNDINLAEGALDP